MNHKNWAFLVLFLVLFVGFLAPSCAKKELKSEPVMAEDEARRRAEEEARKRFPGKEISGFVQKPYKPNMLVNEINKLK